MVAQQQKHTLHFMSWCKAADLNIMFWWELPLICDSLAIPCWRRDWNEGKRQVINCTYIRSPI